MDELPNIAKDTSSRFHPELDFNRMRSFHEDLFVFHEKSLERNPPEDREGFYAEMVSDREQELATVDRLEARQHLQTGYVPTDVFMMTYGEPPERSMTKIGGAPYWPSDHPWPTNWLGKPLRFVAQVNFTDSRDLFDSLPNDVLVLFEGAFGRREFWLPAGLTDLIDPDDIPKTKRHYFPTYGAIQRLYDPPLSDRPEIAPLSERVNECIKIGGNPWAKKARFPREGTMLFQIHGLDGITKEWACGWYSLQHPPLTVFLMPDGKLRYVTDRYTHAYARDELDLDGIFEIRRGNDGKHEVVRSYEFGWRWPFIQRIE